MTSADLLPAAVLKRKAVVYVRQSTQAQVQSNLEGTVNLMVAGERKSGGEIEAAVRRRHR